MCPGCSSDKHKRVRPLGWVAFKWDRVCKDCGTRYTPPTPGWAAVVFLGAGLLLAGFGVISVLLALASGNPLSLPVVACEGFVGVVGCLAIAHGVRTLQNPGEV
ncbi:MAG: hypothetical protein K2V38_02205 [Gemmataceae bacterium]|nr:hypothetical protein [Gemmataceae bacterium]